MLSFTFMTIGKYYALNHIIIMADNPMPDLVFI
jgi:hypothetical protein